MPKNREVIMAAQVEYSQTGDQQRMSIREDLKSNDLVPDCATKGAMSIIFPMHGWRLLALAVVWNVLFIVDRVLLGYPVVGPFSVFAFALLAVLSFSAPSIGYPGRWVIKDPQFATRWRYLFWYLGVLATALALLAVYEVLFGL